MLKPRRRWAAGSSPVEGAERSGLRFSEVDAAFDDVKEYARGHGGTLKLEAVSDEGVVFVSMTGTCHHCPLSTITLKVMLQDRLKKRVPWVQKVERVEPSTESP